MVITVLFLVGTMAIVLGFATIGVTQARISRDTLNSNRSYFAAESVLEDVAYRITDSNRHAEGAYTLPFSYTVDELEYIVSPNEVTGVDTHRVVGSMNGAVRATSFALAPAVQGSWSADLQVGLLGVELKNTASVYGQIYTNGPITGSGQANNVAFLRQRGDSYLKVAQQKSLSETEQNPGVGGTDKFIYVRKTNTTDNVAQEFVPGYSGWLQAFTVYMCKTATSFTGQIDFSLRANIDGGGGLYAVDKPAASAIVGSAVGAILTQDLQSCSINASPESTDYTLMKTKVFLNKPYLVQAGVPYWIVISPEACLSCSKYYKMIATPDNEYGGTNSAITSGITTLWSNTNGTDAIWCRAGEYSCTSTNVLTTVPVDLAFIAHVSTEPGRIENITVVNCLSYDSTNKTCLDQNWSTTNVCGGPDADRPFVLAGDIKDAIIRVKPYTDTTDSSNPYFTNGCTSVTASSAPPAIPKPYTQDTIDGWKMGAGWLPAGLYRKNNTNDPDGICEGGIPPGHPDWNSSEGNCNLKCNSVLSNGCDGNNDFDGLSPTLPSAEKDHAVIRNFTHTSGTLSIRNHIYVTGNLTIGGGQNCRLQIDPAAVSADDSLVIVVEGTVDVGTCAITGEPGNSESHILIVSMNNGLYEKPANTPAIWIHNSCECDLFYAHNGLVQLNNSTKVNAIYGERVIMEQTAAIQSVLEGIGAVSFKDTGVFNATEPRVPGNWGESL